MKTIHLHKICPKCGTDQWLVPDAYWKQAPMPRLPIGAGRSKEIKQRKKIADKAKKERDALLKRAVCQMCIMGGADMFKTGITEQDFY